jgi:hypothetical protein
MLCAARWEVMSNGALQQINVVSSVAFYFIATQEQEIWSPMYEYV